MGSFFRIIPAGRFLFASFFGQGQAACGGSFFRFCYQLLVDAESIFFVVGMALDIGAVALHLPYVPAIRQLQVK